MSAVVPASLRLSIDIPAEVRVGEIVPITLRLENVGSRTLDLYLRGRTIAFDIVVTARDGRVVWRRLDGEIVPAIIQHVPLAAGEVLELRADWDQHTASANPVEPGLYMVRGVLLTDSQDPLEIDSVPLRIIGTSAT